MIDDGRSRVVGVWLAVGLSILGAAVLAGWHLAIPGLIQINTAWAPMQYNAALSFLALGLGLVACAGELAWIAALLSLVPLAIGGITFATWIFDLYPGIDERFFQHYITTLTPVPGRMPINNALSLAMCGLATFFAAFRSRAMLASCAWLVGWIVLVRGVLGTVWAMLDAGGLAYAFSGTSHMAIHASLGFVAAGGAITLITHAVRARAQPISRALEVPLLVGILVLMIAQLMWQALSVAELTRTREAGHGSLLQIASLVRNDSERWDAGMARIGRRLAHQSNAARNTDWEREAREYFNGNTWLREMVWFNDDGSVQSRVARDPAEYLPTDLQLSGARSESNGPGTRKAVSTLWLRDPGRGGVDALAYLVLHYDSTGSPGGMAFVIRVDGYFADAVGLAAREFDVWVKDGDRLLFSRGGSSSFLPASTRDAETLQLEVFGRSWSLGVQPGVARASDPAALLPRLVFLFGVVLSLLISVVLRYAGMAREQASGVLKAGARLEREVEDRRAAELASRSSEERARYALAEIQQILNQSQDLICTVNREGRFLVVSASCWQILGYRPEEMLGKYWSEFAFQDDLEVTRDGMAETQDGRITRDFESRFVHRDGSLVHLSWSSAWLEETSTHYSIGRDVTTRRRQDLLRDGQRHALQLIAGGATLNAVLDAICGYVELIDTDSRCSVLLLDADGRRLRSAAAPRLPPEYVAGVDGIEIGPAAGCCGTAAWQKQFVVVHDIASSPLWDDFRPLALRHGLRSCWSMPIFGEHGELLGTFATYHLQPRSPQPHEIEMIEAAVGLASVAIERNEAHRQLFESNEQLEFARRVAQLGYWEISFENGRVLLSADMLEKLGLPVGPDQDFNSLLRYVYEADRAMLVEAREAAFKQDSPVDLEIRLVLQNGALRYVHFLGRTLRREDGHLVKLAGTAQDITSRKLIELENTRLYAELESRVRSRTRELEQSNRELEAFSYSVSHDLRAPLRAISGFGALLRDESGPAVGVQGRHYLDRIIAGAVRMAALIDDLLELGRVSRIDINRQPLDLTALATQVSGRLHERWPDRRVEVEIQPDLVALGDLRLIEVVLENLLENAWKFTNGRTVAQVRIGKVRDLGEHAFFVSDNGVGFDPQYAENLFGVFQRLHAASAFPGTGVGLATVQRILQRHGGRIWAEAQVDRGATFYFTLS